MLGNSQSRSLSHSKSQNVAIWHVCSPPIGPQHVNPGVVQSESKVQAAPIVPGFALHATPDPSLLLLPLQPLKNSTCSGVRTKENPPEQVISIRPDSLTLTVYEEPDAVVIVVSLSLPVIVPHNGLPLAVGP